VLLQQHHPDKVEGAKQQEALRITQLIRESYDVLSDPIKRTEHDRWIKEQESGKDENKYNEKQSYQKQDDNASPQVPIENNSGCFWIIGLVAFCFWIFSGDDKPPIVEATEVRQEQFVAQPLSKSYEAVQEKIVSPPLQKTDIELLNSAKELLKQKQFESALKIYRNLAESDNLAVQAEAQNELGVRYSEGTGVTQSYSIAMLWFQKSANQKYAGAEYNLGWLYEKGLGVQKDYAMAVFWYQKATDHGYSTEHSKNALVHLSLSNDNPSIIEDSGQLSVTEKATLLEQRELRQLSQSWSEAHSSKDATIFSNLYDNFILFYGTKMDRNSTLEAKLKLFKKYPDLYHQIYGDIQFEKQTDGTIKSSFTKRVTVTQKTTDYPAYLIFKKSNNGWKITVESDLVTDSNIAKKSNAVDIMKNENIAIVQETSAAKSFVIQMIDYALDNGGVGHESEIQEAKLKIDALPKPAKGNKKAARKINDQGLVLLNIQDFDGAVEKFLEANSLDASDIEVVNNLGFAYLKQNNLDSAKQTLITTLTMSPDRAVAWSNLGYVFSLGGDELRAAACYANSYRFSKDTAKTRINT
jgi:tetratricopeptide (TPR) repeat protein